MALFSQRSRGYRLGMIMVLIAAKLALFGLVAPGWLKLTSTYGFTTYLGLWFWCSEPFSDCTDLSISGFTTLYYTTIVFAVLGVFVLFIAYLFAIVVNCCTTVDIRRRTLEFCAIKGGVNLFIACMLFVGDYNNDTFDWRRYNDSYSYGPSFAVTLTASIVALIGGFMVARHNQPITPYMSFTVGAGGVQRVQHQHNYSVQPQPQNIYYTGAQYSHTMNSASPPPPYPGVTPAATEEAKSSMATK